MRLLDRYLLRELLIPLTYCLVGFLLFWIAFDLFGRLEDFSEKQVPPGMVAHYYLVMLPEFLVLVIPIALLLAVLYALTNHSRHHEITAIRAAGISLWRLSAPYLWVGFGASIGLFAMNELLVPASGDKASAIMAKYRQKSSRQKSMEKHFFRSIRGNRTWKIESFNMETSEMTGVEVDWTKPDGALRSIFADRAEFNEDGHWVFHEVQILDQPPGPFNQVFKTQMPTLVAPEFAETPEQIRSEIKVSTLTNRRAGSKSQLSISEILHYRRLHAEIPPDRERMLSVQMQRRLSEPWTAMVVVLIGLAFGSAPGGRRNVFVGVAASIFICFSYYVLQGVCIALGMGGYLPPWLAGWTPNLIGSGIGLFLIARSP